MPTMNIDETACVTIAAPVELVRRQFGDIDHHARSHPHRGVRFDVIDSTSEQTHYRQTSRVGPFRISQTLTLAHTATGPLVNTVTAGPFSGGTITFAIAFETADTTRVDARLSATTTGIEALIGRITRRRLQRTLAAALDEDRIDLESGKYQPPAR